MFKALSSRNFRVYYCSQGISFTGNLIQEIALSWFIYNATGEAYYVGLLFFMKQIAAFFLSPLSGVLSDKISIRSILLTTNAIMLVIASVMSFVVWQNSNVVFWILVLQGASGLVSGIDMPARQAFVKELVSDHAQLINAIALNSSLFNIARICSPLVAGILIPMVGEVSCILINAASFIVAISGILIMSNLPVHVAKQSIRVVKDVREGLKYTFYHPTLKKIMIVTACISFFGWPFTILLPVFTKEILGGGVRELGYLTTAVGIGSLLSALYMASRKNVGGLQVQVCIACGIYGLGIILFSSVASMPLALVSLVQVGIGQVLIFSACNSMIQTTSESQMTGRVISLYIMTFMGATTVGSFIIGIIADHLGAIVTLIIAGVGCLSTCFYLYTSINSIKKRIIVSLSLRKNFRKYVIKEIPQ